MINWNDGAHIVGLVLCCGLAVACGDTGDSPDLSGASGAASAQGATGGAGGASGMDSPSGGSPAERHGYIFVQSTSQYSEIRSSAGFYDTPSVFDPACQVVTDSFCLARVCTGSAFPVSPTPVSAGTITIRGAESMGRSLLEPSAANEYTETHVAPALFFLAGEEATITASGGAVPAFEFTGTYPRPLSIVGPPDEGGMIPIIRDEGISLTLTPSDGQLLLSGRGDGDGRRGGSPG